MKNVAYLYNGKPIRNLKCYYLASGAYIEEFDTDGGHFVFGCDIQDYPDEIREEAMRIGIIDEKGELIPWIGTEPIQFD